MSDSFDVSGVLPDGMLDEVPAGTNLLTLGPAMSGKQEIALELLATGYQYGDGILCITTESAQTVYEDIERHVDSLDRNRIGIVDTSGRDGTELLDATIESTASPGDLTGISIGMSKLFQHFKSRGISDVRYGLISLSTLLQYLDSRKVFKFIHVYTKRIETTEGLGIYTLDGDSHDQQVVNTIRGQFDGVIELREADDGALEGRVRGFGRRPTSWTEL